MPSTEELVKAAQAGGTAAFAELIRRYERAAIVTAYSVLGDFHWAQDAAQEAFVIAYQKLGGLRDAASFGPWLLRIARHRAVRLKRGRKAETADIDCIESTAIQPGEWMQPYNEVVQQIARLPEHERIVTVMRYMNGLSVNEIAEATGRPMGTITKQLSRAIERLRNWLVEVRS
ncbi:MAG: sigma-70 family RNA polymerase sigma factor [Thermoguttaceae bacterium]|jgi:RNA polymerase sigma-70 factor (ECF subfamily)